MNNARTFNDTCGKPLQNFSRTIFHELHASGTTMVVVTHDMEVALQADRIIEMKDGRISSDRPTGTRRGEAA